MSTSNWGNPLWGDGTFVDPSGGGGGTGGGSGGGTGGGGGGGTGGTGQIQIVQVAPAVIQQDTGSGTHTLTLTFPNNLTPGNTVLVTIGHQCNGPLSDIGSPSVTDSATPTPNSYRQLAWVDSGGNSDGGGGGIFLSVIAAAAKIVTFSYVGTPGVFSSPFEVGASAVEYSGMGPIPALQNSSLARVQGSGGNFPLPLTVTDSHGTPVTVTFQGPGPNGANGIGSIETFAGVADILAGTIDYVVAWSLSQAPSLLLPVGSPSAYATFTQEANARDGVNNYSIWYWDPGTAGTAGGGGGGGTASIVLNPPQGTAGSTLTVDVTGTGTNFVSGASGTAVTISGDGAVISNVVVNSATDLTFTLTLSSTATLGARIVTTQTGAEAPTATFTILANTGGGGGGTGGPVVKKRGNIAWSQIRLGPDGTFGDGYYGASTDGSGAAGIIPVWGGPDGITLVASTLTGTAGGSTGTGGSNAITLGGDLGGTDTAPLVIGLQGTPLSATPPTSGQVLEYNGTTWIPTTVSSGGVAGGDLSGTYPNPTVTQIAGAAIAPLPSSPSYLKYTPGTGWTFAATAAPAIRGTGIQASSSANYTVSWPAGTAAGDLAVITWGHAWPLTVPSGWGTADTQVGSNWLGGVITRILSSADIIAGSVALSFSNSFDGVIAITTFIGNAAVKSISSARNSTGSATITVNSDGSLVTTDMNLYFGSNRGASTDTVSLGTLQQQANDASSASGCLYTGAPAAGGVSPVFSYSSAGTGNYQAIVTIKGVF